MLNFDHPIEHPAMLSAQLAIRVLRAYYYYWRQKGRYRVTCSQSDAKRHSSHCRGTRIADISLITPQPERLLLTANCLQSC